ncbi:hypothetical protein [Flavobacterium sp.]|uniref:hypothetical protein n=1 Tax=Flavobacterium sp. TaxID=239 RepID=UPI00404753F1
MRKIFFLTLTVLSLSCSSDESDEPQNNSTLPVLTTTNVSNITLIGATSGGNITSNGGTDIIVRGVVWSTSQNPTISLNTKTTDGTGVGSFTSSINNLTTGTTYYIRAYATNSDGTAYGNEISFTTATLQIPILTTTNISSIQNNSALSGGNITSDGGTTISVRGVVWSTSQNPTVALTTKTTDGSGIGIFTSNITGLNPNTQYYVRSYATNNIGTAYGNEISLTTTNVNYASMYPTGTVFCNNVVTAVIDVTSPTTGRIWMDRNLGASRLPTQLTDADAIGDYYQWGRRADGHQCRDSNLTNTLSSTDQPGHGDFISYSSSLTNFDWRSPQNNNLWQGVNGVNNPCPNGYRLPSITEWLLEAAVWEAVYPDSNTLAYNSPLKITGGRRRTSAGFLFDNIGSGSYWSSTTAGTKSVRLGLGTNVNTDQMSRINGLSVRCIKN